MIKRNVQPPPTNNPTQNPTTQSYVYLRIQPFISSLAVPQHANTTESDATSHATLQFVLYLSDPSHQITHSTVTQSVPEKWLKMWDEYDWVEDLVVEAIRVGVEVLGQEYIVSRMGWEKKAAEAVEDVSQEGGEPTAQ